MEGLPETADPNYPLSPTRFSLVRVMVHKVTENLLRALLLPSLFLTLSVLLAVMFASGIVLAADYDSELQNVMQGNLSGLTARVSGSGSGWYGDSMRVHFTNNTGETLKVKVPVGLRLIPAKAELYSSWARTR